ncbi:MAG: hypothetical protein QM770_22200 [Tepidisphaeraceae bacterium]
MTQPTPLPTDDVADAVAVSSPGIGYFSERQDLNARALRNLQGFATPTGPRGDWPLNDIHLMEFANAVILRKRILAASGAARLLCGLGVIACAIMGLTALGLLFSSRTGPAEMLAFGIPFVVLLAITVVYGLAARAIRECKNWASITLGSLMSVGAVVSVGASVIAMGNARQADTGPLMLVTVVYLVIYGVFIYTFFRATVATPRYLATPVWCQEVLAVSEKPKR